MKGKILVITKCKHCPHISLSLSSAHYKSCTLTGEDVQEAVIRGTMPSWCPLPDADRVLEKKGTNINDERP